MKKVLTTNIGGKNFMVDEDAFTELKIYLDNFKSTIADPQEADEVMGDIEMRVAEILREQLRSEMQTVNCAMVNHVIAQLGTPEGATNYTKAQSNSAPEPVRKRLYRDVDTKMIGGVCGGLAAYWHVDVVIIRLIALGCLLLALSSFWIYLILWIVVPAARTATEKLQMRGEPATAENIKNTR